MRGDLAAIGVATAALAVPLGYDARAAAVAAIAILAYLATVAWARRGVVSAPARSPWPDCVTLLRGCLGGLLLASVLVPDPGIGVVVVGVAAIGLDAVDGWLARRLDAASAFGARLDMETDAAVMLVLCLVLAAQDRAHASVLAVGLARYAFVAAGFAVAALRAPLAESVRRRAVAGGVMTALALALVPAVPPRIAVLLAGAATIATLASFAIDVARLLRGPRPA